MTGQRDSQPTSEGGASRFNSRGQRVNEIDLDNRPRSKTIAEMTDSDWEQAAAALREFDGGAR